LLAIYNTKKKKKKIEQRYREYLDTFQSSPFFCLENETINDQDFLILNEYLKKNQDIKELMYSFLSIFFPSLFFSFFFYKVKI